MEKDNNRYKDYEDYSDSSLTKAQARINLANSRQQVEEGKTLIDTLERRNLDLEIGKAEADLGLLRGSSYKPSNRRMMLPMDLRARSLLWQSSVWILPSRALIQLKLP